MTPTVLFVIVLSLGWPVHSSSVRNHTQALLFTDGQRVVELGVATPTLRRTAPDGQGLVDTTVTCRTYTHNTNQPLAMYGPIRAVDNDDMNMLLEICHNNPTHNRRHKRFILPGTKWCGLGNSASDYEELGSDVQTDSCCRTHDHCPDHISPFQTKNGITNFSFLYRFNCACEERFYNCLKEVTNENSASLVGQFYFNLLEPTCFRIDHPTKCVRKGWWFLCKKKILDTTKPQAWNFYKFGKSF